MHLPAILIGGLFLSVLFQLYSARRHVMDMEFTFNLSKTLIDFDEIDPAATSIPTVRHSHCAIVVSRLYGKKHTERRRRLALDWYRNLTVNSIRLAAERSSMAAVMIVLNNTESYANEVVDDTDTLGSVLAFFQNGASGSMESTNSKVQRMASKRQCHIRSIMRLDADDMLLPGAFQNIELGWRDVMSSNNCTWTNADHHCPHALVSGIQHNQVIRYVLDPVASDGTTACSIRPPRGAHGSGGIGNNKLEFTSNGLVVTMTHEVWMSRFIGDLSLIVKHHRRLPRTVAKRMRYFNIRTNFQTISSNHSGWIQTPLSGHYQSQRRDQQPNCTLHHLTQLLGKEGGEMLWNIRWFVPRLTRDEWKENRFLADNKQSWVRQAKKLHAEKW